jgi:hypothetical protein
LATLAASPATAETQGLGTVKSFAKLIERNKFSAAESLMRPDIRFSYSNDQADRRAHASSYILLLTIENIYVGGVVSTKCVETNSDQFSCDFVRNGGGSVRGASHIIDEYSVEQGKIVKVVAIIPPAMEGMIKDPQSDGGAHDE